MGFLNPLKTIGKGLSKLPGAKAFNKPINKVLGKTPGLKSVPQKLGMAPKKSPIGPSAGALAGNMKNAATAAPPPMAQQLPAPPQMTAPPPMEMPPMQAPPPMQQPQPMEQTSLGGDLAPQLQGWGNAMPTMQPQVDPNLMASLQQRMGQNRGPIGRRPSGIGPRFMG